MWLLLIYLGLLYSKQAPPLVEVEVTHSAGGEHYLREHQPCVCPALAVRQAVAHRGN